MRERPYQKLIAWKEAHALCKTIYSVTKSFPSEEKFALVNQMRRAAYSVPTNIAEGNAKRTKKDHVHFLDIAIGSLEELHYQSLLAYELDYITKEISDKIDDSVQRTGFLLNQLRTSLL